MRPCATFDPCASQTICAVFCSLRPRGALFTPPSDRFTPLTAARPTIAVEWPSAAQHGLWSAVVQFVDVDEWRAVMEAASAAANRAGVGKVPRETDAGFVAYSKAAAVYGRRGQLVDPAELMMHSAVAGRLGHHVELRAADCAELAQLTRPYMDSADEASDGALWPLVQRVRLRGPFAVCAPSLLAPGGVRLLDAPGLHDDNAARDGVLRGVVAEAAAVLVVSNIRRACNDKGSKEMMPLPLRKALLERGFVGEFAFVATQTDLLTPSELIQNLRLPPDSSARTCALARNAFTKTSVSRDFYADLPPNQLPCNRPLPATWGEEASFEFPVFTISARDYQIVSGMRTSDGAPRVFSDEDATEVPALRAFLQLAASARHSCKDGTRRVGRLLLECLEAAKKAHPPTMPPTATPAAPPAAPPVAAHPAAPAATSSGAGPSGVASGSTASLAGGKRPASSDVKPFHFGAKRQATAATTSGATRFSGSASCSNGSRQPNPKAATYNVAADAVIDLCDSD